METDALRRLHRRDQAAAALGQVTDVERRAAHRSGHPPWFWALSGLGFAALPVSTHAGAGRDVVALGGLAVVVVALLAASRGRRVHERCVTLGVRGWCRQTAVFLPAIVVVVAAVAVSDSAAGWAAGWWVPVAASAASAVAWIVTGALSGNVAPTTR